MSECDSGEVTFEIGDIVELNSGGPSLVVSSIDGDNVVVEWFDEEGQLHRATFNRSMLTY